VKTGYTEKIAKKAGNMVNIFNFIPPAENIEAAYLIVRALIERYLLILLRFYSNCCYDCSSRVYYWLSILSRFYSNFLKFVELLSMMAPS